jgi:hypothetical protein
LTRRGIGEERTAVLRGNKRREKKSREERRGGKWQGREAKKRAKEGKDKREE